MTKNLRKAVIMIVMASLLTTSIRIEAVSGYDRYDTYANDNTEVCFAGQCYLQTTLTNIAWGWLIAGPIVLGAIIALSLANHHHRDNNQH